MSLANKQKAEALRKKAAHFLHVNTRNDGQMLTDDRDAYDSMIAGAEALEAGGITTQEELDNEPATIRGIKGGKGSKFVDANGKIRRGLTHADSMEHVVRDNPQVFGVTADEIKLVDDGLTIGDYCRAMVTGPRTSAEPYALSGGSDTAGGYTMPSILAAMLIDRFRTRMVLSRAGAQTLPLEGDEHSFAKITADPTPTRRRENNAIGNSEPTFGRLTFYPKSLAVLIKSSRELLQDSPNIGTAIERTMTASMAVEVDRVGLAGAGNTEPLGLLNEAGLNEITGVGALTDYSDFVDGWKKCLDGNAPDPSAAIISNREWATLAKLEDTTGQPLNLPPAVSKLPFLPTSAVSTTLGGGGAESYSILGAFADLIIGMRSQLQIEVLKELFGGDHQYGYVAHLRMDTGVFHTESFCRLLGITA